MRPREAPLPATGECVTYLFVCYIHTYIFTLHLLIYISAFILLTIAKIHVRKLPTL